MTIPAFIEKGLVIDIDDTLCDTSAACTQKVLETFHISLAPGESIEKLLLNFAYPWRVPAWSTVEYQNYIQQILQDTHFLESIPPIEDSRKGLNTLTKKYPLSFYLTSRPLTTQQATENWLKTNNFPDAPVVSRDTSLIDPEWKIEYIAKNAPQTIAFIDNEVHWNPEIKFAGKIFEIVRFRPHNLQTEKICICQTWDDIALKLE